MGVYGLHAVNLAGTILTQATQVSISPGLAHMISAAAGQVDPTFVAVSKAAPAIAVTTTELKRVLDKMTIPVNGLAVTNAGAPVILWFQLHSEYSTRSTDSDFLTVTITDGLVWPTTMSAQDGQEAVISFNMTPGISTGVNVVTIQTGVGNPAIDMIVDQQWTAGPLKVNSASLDPAKFNLLQNFSLDFGIEVETISGDGAVYAKFVSIRSRRPTLTAQLTDHTAFTQLVTDGAPIGVPQDGNSSTVFLRKMLKNAARVAAETAEHIAIIMDDGRIVPQSFDGSGPAAMNAGIQLLPAFDNEDPIIAIDTAIAIS